jgi:hypothetical protein
MKTKHVIAVLLSFTVAASLAGCAEAEDTETATQAEAEAAPAASNPADAADGEQLEREMWMYIDSTNWTAVESKIAAGFQSIHLDGPRDKAGEMELFRKLNGTKAELSDFKVTKSDDEIIVTYTISVGETIGGQRMSTAPARRLSVWQFIPGAGWQWTAHANLKTPS